MSSDIGGHRATSNKFYFKSPSSGTRGVPKRALAHTSAIRDPHVAPAAGTSTPPLAHTLPVSHMDKQKVSRRVFVGPEATSHTGDGWEGGLA